MNILRRTARIAMSAFFISGGLDALRDPGGRADLPEDLVDTVSRRLPGMQDADTETVIRMNGGVQVAAGTMLALNKAPRPAAMALSASVVPPTIAAHRFWEMDGPQRREHAVHLLKNLAIWGGLVVAALDTEGEPGVAWRTTHALDHAEREASHRRELASMRADLAREQARAAAAGLHAKATEKTADARVATATTKAKAKATKNQAVRDARMAKKAAATAGRGLASAGRTAINASTAGGRMAVKGVKALTPA